MLPGRSCCKPAALNTRYRRLIHALGIRTTLHKLRHYSATELLATGVDLRTVADRLGHSEGGTTPAYVSPFVGVGFGYRQGVSRVGACLLLYSEDAGSGGTPRCFIS